MEKQTKANRAGAPTVAETPWIRWNAQFHKLLPPEEIPEETPLIEEFLDTYLHRFTGRRITWGNFKFKYSWHQLGPNPLRYVLQVFLRPVRRTRFLALPKAPAEPLIIIKDDSVYMVDDKRRKRSTKNTVKLKPPST